MQLSPREKDKLLIAMAAEVARKRKSRGVKLNYPEAISLICDAVVCLLYTSPSPRDRTRSRMPSSA